MTDKEFLELLMLYKGNQVSLVKVGLALANNQFSHEYIALANNILMAKKEESKVSNPQTSSYEVKELISTLRAEKLEFQL